MPFKPTHGMTETKTFRAWIHMHDRCNRKKHPSYKNYGGRGISVCERWGKFENFLEDMGEAPKNRSLDRINNNGNYDKENCTWSTPKEQVRNRRTTVKLEVKGEKLTLVEIAEILAVPPDTLKHWCYRQSHRNWDKMMAVVEAAKLCQREAELMAYNLANNIEEENSFQGCFLLDIALKALEKQ